MKNKVAKELIKVAKSLVSHSASHNRMFTMQNEMWDMRDKLIPELLSKLQERVSQTSVASFDSILDDRLTEAQMKKELKALQKVMTDLKKIENNL